MATFRVTFLNITTTRTWQRVGRLIGYLACLACAAALLYAVGAFQPAKAFHESDPVADCAADLRTIAMWAELRDDGVTKVQAIPQIAPTEEALEEMGLNAKQKDTVRKRTRLGIQLVWEEGLKDEALFNAWMDRCVKLEGII